MVCGGGVCCVMGSGGGEGERVVGGDDVDVVGKRCGGEVVGGECGV